MAASRRRLLLTRNLPSQQDGHMTGRGYRDQVLPLLDRFPILFQRQRWIHSLMAIESACLNVVRGIVVQLRQFCPTSLEISYRS